MNFKTKLQVSDCTNLAYFVLVSVNINSLVYVAIQLLDYKVFANLVDALLATRDDWWSVWLQFWR